MGVLNVTPDSFSDGGQHDSRDAAIAYGKWLATNGADIVDVGGESTRPGAAPVTSAAEKERVVPVIEALAASGICVSVDTYRAETARAAVAAGAKFVNDVSGGLADENMHATVAQLGVDYILQHWRGTPETMNSLAHYRNCVAEVCAELVKQREHALAAGIEPARIILDPGLGFAKDTEHNWQLLAGLDTIKQLGHRVLIGASRKRFIAQILRDIETDPGRQAGLKDAVEMNNRDSISAMVAAIAARDGAWAVRAHDVIATKRAVAVAAAVNRGACLNYECGESGSH